GVRRGRGGHAAGEDRPGRPDRDGGRAGRGVERSGRRTAAARGGGLRPAGHRGGRRGGAERPGSARGGSRGSRRGGGQGVLRGDADPVGVFAGDGVKREESGLAVRIVPCLDVRGGRGGKGAKVRSRKDAGDPVEAAARYAAEGADEIVFLDISATPEGRGAAREVVEKTAQSLFVPLTVGGGVRTAADAETLLRAGADRVAINS